MDISNSTYRENPIMIPIKDFYKKNKNKSSFKDSEAMQQKPSIRRQSLRNTFILQEMEREKVTGFICLGMRRLVNTLDPLT